MKESPLTSQRKVTIGVVKIWDPRPRPMVGFLLVSQQATNLYPKRQAGPSLGAASSSGPPGGSPGPVEAQGPKGRRPKATVYFRFSQFCSPGNKNIMHMYMYIHTYIYIYTYIILGAILQPTSVGRFVDSRKKKPVVYYI